MAIDETMINGHGEEEMDALSGKGKKSKKKKVRGTARRASGESGYRRAGEGRGVTGMKQKNGAVVTGVLFFASLIVLIYTMLEFRSQLLTVIGASACFLIMAAIVISQLSIAIKAYQKKQNLLIESRLTELQNRLLESGEESQEVANMSAVYVKKISDRLAEFEEELLNYQRKENVLMQRIISTQTKAAKVLVKYNDRNTKSLVSSASHQYEQLEKSLDSSIQHTVEELRKISETVMMIQQTPPEAVTPELLQAQMAAMAEMMPKAEAAPEPVKVEAPAAEPPKAEAAPEPVKVEAPAAEPPKAEAAPEPVKVEAPAAEPPKAEATPEPVKVEAPAAEPPKAEAAPEPVKAEAPAAEPPKAEAKAVEMPADPNAQLSPDQIAALFASSAPEPGMAEPAAEPPKAEAKAVEMPADPNAQLSPDQIAALFASSAPEPEKAEPATPAPAVPDDPNAQLSPDQIAALFAAANG